MVVELGLLDGVLAGVAHEGRHPRGLVFGPKRVGAVELSRTTFTLMRHVAPSKCPPTNGQWLTWSKR